MNATRILIYAFLGGLVLIVGLRTLVTGLSGATLAAMTAVAIIGIVGWRYHKTFDNAEDRQMAGDNLYYLGLLYTLISLILALVQLFVLDTQEDVNQRANELIGNFSVALFSTVAGIFARILFQGHQRASRKQPARNAERSEKQVVPAESGSLVFDADVRELREELARLRLVLREASDAFLHFSRISSEQSETVVAHTGSMMQRQSEDLHDSAIQQLEKMNLSLKSMAEVFQSEMEKLSRNFIDVIDEFQNHMLAETRQGILDTSKAWNDAAVEMKSEGERQIKAVYGDINALLQSTEQTWTQMAALSESIGKSVGGMQGNVDTLQEMVRDSAGAASEMKLLFESLNRARGELETAASAAGQSTAEIKDGIGKFTEIREKLGAEFNETRLKAVKEYRQATTQITDQVSEQLDIEGGRLRSSILKMASDLDNHQKVGAEQLGKADQLSRRMSDEVREWNKLAEHTRNSLVEATEHLVTVVKKS